MANMWVEKVPKEMVDAWKKLDDAEIAYREKFGEDSLDRVIYIDPLHPEVEDYNAATQLLYAAVGKNEPLEQVPKEIWDDLIF